MESLATDLNTPTATAAPPNAKDKAVSLRLELRSTELKAESARTNVANLRNQLDYNTRQSGPEGASQEDHNVLERAERVLLGIELKIEDLKTALKAVKADVAAVERVEGVKRAREARALKVTELSEPQTPRAQKRVAEAEAEHATAEHAHAELQARVTALKAEAAKQDETLKTNALEHAQALVAGTKPPKLIGRIDYADVLKACASALETSRAALTRAGDAVNVAHRELAQAQASDAYATIYAVLAPSLEDLPTLPVHAEQWGPIMMVRSTADTVTITYHRPHSA